MTHFIDITNKKSHSIGLSPYLIKSQEKEERDAEVITFPFFTVVPERSDRIARDLSSNFSQAYL